MHHYRLSILACHHCDKPFEDLEEVCSISASIYDADNFEFEIQSSADASTALEVSRIIHFHKSCFLETAGDIYVP